MAAASVVGCAPDGGGSEADHTDGDHPVGDPSRGFPTAAPVPLPAHTLRAVAEAVLPAELGDDGHERAVAAFQRWSDGLEPVVELAHPYLVPETRYSGPDPRPGWAAQLQGLEKECESRYGKAFGDLDIPARRNLLARPLGRAGPGLGSPANADHVALALMAHFFASPLATDLCYGRVIAKQQCRGLEGALGEPVALSAGAAP